MSLPCITRWADLADADIEIFSPGTSKGKVWDGGMVLRLHGMMVLHIVPSEAGLMLSEGNLRSDGEGSMTWVSGDAIGYLAPAPQDYKTEKRMRGYGRDLEPYTIMSAPCAPETQDRLAVFRRAFSRALGPDAQKRIAAFSALGRARLMTEGSLSGILKPTGDTPRILVHNKTSAATSTQSLFPKASAKGRPIPDARALLNGGDCRLVKSQHDQFLHRVIAPCDEIHLEVSPDASRHALLAAADEAIALFADFGVDVSPWILRRGR